MGGPLVAATSVTLDLLDLPPFDVVLDRKSEAWYCLTLKFLFFLLNLLLFNFMEDDLFLDFLDFWPFLALFPSFLDLDLLLVTDILFSFSSSSSSSSMAYKAGSNTPRLESSINLCRELI